MNNRIDGFVEQQGVGILPSFPAVEIPVHNASIYVQSDISKIVHKPADSRIEILLQPKSTRRCQNPVFKGRISGWSLSTIDFKTSHNKHDDSNVVVGTYDRSQMPMSGKYFVEIIVVLCENYGIDFRTVNLKNQCLEDTKMGNHRITEGNGFASIDVVVVDDRSLSQPKDSRGQWLHRSFLAKEKEERDARAHRYSTESYNVGGDIPTPEPLFTRYQPEECMISERNFKLSKNTEFCQNLVDRKRFDAYTFRWNEGPDEILNKDVLKLPVKKDGNGRSKSKSKQHHIHVCFVGASHSRVLKNKCQSLLDRSRKRADRKGESPLDVECSFMEVLFPPDLTDDWVLSNLGGKRCTHAVVGLFQWPFSFAQNQQNWTFSDWKAEMTTVSKILETAARSNDIPLQRVLLRSAHPNGFKWQISSCPPGDMRSPPNARLASRILQEIVEGFSRDANNSPIISFIDTSFVTDPVWDSPEDWSHYNLEEGSVEAKLILSEILNDI